MQIKILIKALFTSYRKINAEDFIKNWEKKYKNCHDPDPQEVYIRLKMIMNSITNQGLIESKYVLELGAGYGRITKHLVGKLKVKSIEPNGLLFNHLKSVNAKSQRHSFSDIDPNHSFYKDNLIAFSVRSLVYINLIETILFLRKLSKITNILVVYENTLGIKRIQIAEKFARKLKIAKIELYN